MEGAFRLATASRADARAAGSISLAIRATAAYEFRMQIRRRSVWLVLGLLGLFMLNIVTQPGNVPHDSTASPSETWALLLQVFMPAAFGVLLADRLPRDRKLRVDELLETSPAPFQARLLGKYIGATAATLVPILTVYVAGLAYFAGTGGDAAVIATTAVPAFLLMNLPGLLFVAAFSVCGPLLMPVPVYQFLFVGYWFWGNIVPPTIMPTLSYTWLAPIGYMAARGLFHVFEASTGGPHTTVADAVISISLLLALAAAALVAGWLVLRFQRNRP